MVRLGDLKDKIILSLMEYFNSTMVRLGVVIVCFLYMSIARFQFHYGSIGSAAAHLRHSTFSQISIPLWFDWEILSYEKSKM